MAGSAVIMEAWRQTVPAILMLWYPGQEGGHALADILLGKVNPSGRLPCTFPASADHLPFFDRDATAITYDLWHGYRKLLRDGNAAGLSVRLRAQLHDVRPRRTSRLAADTLRPTGRCRRRSTSPTPAGVPATTSSSSTSPCTARRSSVRRAN